MNGSRSWQERRWRRAGLHALGLRMEEYDRYLENQHWQDFRKLVLQKQRNEDGHNHCQSCSGRTRLQVHHRTYERLGREVPSDVVVLCKPCHDKLHMRDEQSRKRNYAPGFR